MNPDLVKSYFPYFLASVGGAIAISLLFAPKNPETTTLSDVSKAAIIGSCALAQVPGAGKKDA